MTSKEALYSLVEIYDITKNTKQYKIITKALDRLEQLEIENRNNEKVIADGVKLINRNLELQSRLESLENENKELTKQKNATIELMELMALDNDIVESALILDKYKTENEKLKKAFKLVTDIYLMNYWDIAKKLNNNIITQQEYELLKEVLESCWR